LSLLKYSLSGPALRRRKRPVSFGFRVKSSLGVQLGQSAALYCRVSTADQTCARQERDLRAFAKKAGYKVVGVWKETASGAKDNRAKRKEVLALAQARNIDVILVTELTRWGRSMLDLFHTLQDLQAWDVSLVAQTGLPFDLRTAQGKLITSLMAALAEFERDLLRERVRSGMRLPASVVLCSADVRGSASKRTVARPKS
jgi:putative DNA-invertase from lambdoid prophage Rac